LALRSFSVFFLLLLLAGCSSSGTWGWYVIDPTTKQGYNNIRFLINGFGATILLSITAAVLSMGIGLIVALPGMSDNRWIRMPSRIYIDINANIDAFWGAIITLAISDSAFTAEIYRSGIQSINKGQTEAAKTIGLNYSQTMRYVILPQAIKRILPPLANQFIYIVKMSAFASVIGMQELTRRANELVVTEYRPLEIYTLLIFEYLILVLLISSGVRWLERKMGADESK
jgi:glutamine transport system permease protein